MNEDMTFDDFLKTRLEDGVPEVPPRLDAILRTARESAETRAKARRVRLRAWGGLLAAASIAVICLFAVHLRKSSPSPARSPERASKATKPIIAERQVEKAPSPEQTVVDAIQLLSAVDGDDLDVEHESASDILLAWQDAPYKDALPELFSGN